MSKSLSLTFLGTSAGGGPTLSRACTSTAISFDKSIWLVDCAEGTERQMLFGKLKVTRVSMIFVTHLHMDHCMGIAPLMSTLMSAVSNPSPNEDSKRIDIFGPHGIRVLLRTILTITQTSLSGKYAVHELLSVADTPCSCDPSEMHSNEAKGQDLYPSAGGHWTEIMSDSGWTVSAGMIKHRVPCLGYVFQEAPGAAPFSPSEHIEPLERNAEALANQGLHHPRSLLRQLLHTRQPIFLPDGTVVHPPPLSVPGRKLVLLGDTCDPWGMKDIAMDASLLVHEATNAYIPPEVDKRASGSRDSQRSVKERALLRGHATPVMAGEFARAIRAKRLILNHFSAKFPSPGTPPAQRLLERSNADPRLDVMQEIEKQASEAWGSGRAIAAYDLMCIDIPTHEPSD